MWYKKFYSFCDPNEGGGENDSSDGGDDQGAADSWFDGQVDSEVLSDNTAGGDDGR